MKHKAFFCFLLGLGLIASGCATVQREDNPSARVDVSGFAAICRVSCSSNLAWEKILALNAGQVNEQEVRGLLTGMPAPQIIAIHGGIFPIESGLKSFARFLVAMGYPEASIRNPVLDSYGYGYYDQSEEIAGAVAWYYERDGLRPMIVGHSQGGIQVVRVLHKLAGEGAQRLQVFNPLTQLKEERFEITDPSTGTTRPVVGLRIPYATAAVAGGIARLLPNQWDMAAKLRQVPDSVEEFTGFQKGLDPLGGDLLGYGSGNDYHPTGAATVRNVRLPSICSHSTIPYAASLLNNEEVRKWITRYQPAAQMVNSVEPECPFGLKSARILWAAEVWHSIKKHWVLELQRSIRAHRAHHHGF